ncbi:MAG TPA: hypothetical protein VH500_22930, partial [Nitrososphaeraceae archaeon]
KYLFYMYYMNAKSLAAIGVVAIVATLVVATLATTGHNVFARIVHEYQDNHAGCDDTCGAIAQQSRDSDNKVSGGFNISVGGGGPD